MPQNPNERDGMPDQVYHFYFVLEMKSGVEIPIFWQTTKGAFPSILTTFLSFIKRCEQNVKAIFKKFYFMQGSQVTSFTTFKVPCKKFSFQYFDGPKTLCCIGDQIRTLQTP